MALTISSPFCQFKAKKAHGVGETDYIYTGIRETVKDGFDPKYPDQFIIEKECIEVERVPIAEYVNSFNSSVGLKNLLKGVISKKQLEDLISRTEASGGDIDITKLPTNSIELEKLAGSVDSIWASIPDELKSGLSKEEFIKSITASQIQNFVASQVAAQASIEEKGDN